MLYFHYGCKVNQYESNAIAQKIIENGYKIVDFNDIADIYIINTCTVTNISDKKSRQIIRRTKQINKNALVIAIGCYAQVAKDKLKEIEEVDLILGTDEKKDIVDIINKYESNKQKEYVSNLFEVKEFAEFGTISYTEKTRAIIKVQDGCDRFCSYCIIPYARGRVRSRKIENILKEIEKLVEDGINEIVITGIHIASYGKDFSENIGLIDLLEQINKISGLKRIRLGSIEPSIITSDFVARLKKIDKICEHFHLSLQSGCDETLKRMNRQYTVKEFEKSVNLLREAYENVVLTTDIIVGFPGETEKEFEETYNFLKNVKFYNLHVFKYSQRNGTKAAVMENQVLPKIKEERSNMLIELSKIQKEEFHKKIIGKEEKVLWEQCDGKYMKGHTSNYIMIYANKNDCIEGEIQKVRIIEIFEDGVMGKVI